MDTPRKEKILSDLRRMNLAKAQIPLLEFELQQKQKAVGSTFRYPDCPAGFGSRDHYRENTNDKYLIETEQLQERIDDLQSHIDLFEQLLAEFPQDERVLLNILASAEKSSNKIARAKAELHCGRSQVYRLRDRALQRLTELIYESGLDKSLFAISDIPGRARD